jgi:tetratricopeptide (TPR) repeat protein
MAHLFCLNICLTTIFLIVINENLLHINSSGLVGPGAVSPYSGGRRGRSRGYTTVRDPSHGFYVGGSSIDEINGLYGRINSIHHHTIHTEFHLAYKHDYHNWFLCLVKADPSNKEYDIVGNKKSEWVFIDDGGNDIFAHEGDTIIPGSGTSWKHVHRPSPLADRARRSSSNSNNNNAVQMVNGSDDLEELPWSMVAIMGEDMLNQLRRRERHRRRRIQLAEIGHGLPTFGPGSQETEPGINMDDEFIHQTLYKKANELFENKKYEDAKHIYDDILKKKTLTKSLHLNMWGHAIIKTKIAASARRLKDFDAAKQELANALRIYPQFKNALFQLAVTAFDSGDYDGAIHNFEKVLKLDRSYQDLDRLLTLTHACIKRKEQAREKLMQDGVAGNVEGQETAYCIAWRQTGNCDGEQGPREPNFDLGCDQAVPEGASGYCECRASDTKGYHPVLGGGTFSTEMQNTFRTQVHGCGHSIFTCGQSCINAWNIKLDEAAQYEKELVDKNTHQNDIDNLVNIRKEAMQIKRDVVKKKEQTKQERLNEIWRTQNYYELLGVLIDFRPDELKKSYRKMSVKYHPDKRKDHSNEAFQTVAEAYEVLQDIEKRNDYDFGKEFDPPEDSNRYPYREDIIRRYFPERFKFEPFGNPHTNDYGEVKRDLLQFRKRKKEIMEAAEEKARLANNGIEPGDSSDKARDAGGFEPIENFDDDEMDRQYPEL